MDPRCLETEANEILTAIVHGMRRDEPSNHVKLAATNALLNSLEFTRGNFEKDAERHFIMQVVCEATQSEDVQVKRGFVLFYMTLKFFCLLFFKGTLTSFFKDKKSKRSHKTVGIQVFLSIFA